MAGDNILRLRNLLDEDFSGTCHCKKSGKKTWYCIDHSSGHCSGCLGGHQHHRIAQIRKYKNRNVVTVEFLGTVINCASIQSYKLGREPVVLLHRMDKEAQPQRQNICFSCQCLLRAPPGTFCSLSCKVDDLEKAARKLEGGSGGL